MTARHDTENGTAQADIITELTPLEAKQRGLKFIAGWYSIHERILLDRAIDDALRSHKTVAVVNHPSRADTYGLYCSTSKAAPTTPKWSAGVKMSDYINARGN